MSIALRPRARGRFAPVLRWASHRAARRAVLPHIHLAPRGAARGAPALHLAPRGAARGAPALHLAPRGAARGAPALHLAPRGAARGAPALHLAPRGAARGAPALHLAPRGAARGAPHFAARRRRRGGSYSGGLATWTNVAEPMGIPDDVARCRCKSSRMAT